MLAPIQLHNQTFLGTKKVQDVKIQRLLPAEFKPAEFSASKLAP